MITVQYEESAYGYRCRKSRSGISTPLEERMTACIFVKMCIDAASPGLSSRMSRGIRVDESWFGSPGFVDYLVNSLGGYAGEGFAGHLKKKTYQSAAIMSLYRRG